MAVEDDFGFTALSEEDYERNIELRYNNLSDDYKDRLKKVEEIILPFLVNLLKTADSPIIKWPNRGPIIQRQIDKIVALTRV